MDDEGLAISRRKITLSTSGVVPMIARCGAELGVNARDLAARGDATSCATCWCRSTRNIRSPSCWTACRTYPGLTNARRITFEYVMLKGVNDSPADARALVRLLAGIPAKVNLIPFNPWPGAPFECSDWRRRSSVFADIVNDAGYSSPVRTPRGRDILAACGQLKSESEKLSARERMALRAMAMTE